MNVGNEIFTTGTGIEILINDFLLTSEKFVKKGV